MIENIIVFLYLSGVFTFIFFGYGAVKEVYYETIFHKIISIILVSLFWPVILLLYLYERKYY